MSETKKLTDLESDALRLLRRLCFDRHVILHATCVKDSRDAYQELLQKHGLMYAPGPHYWEEGTIRASVQAEEPACSDDSSTG